MTRKRRSNANWCSDWQACCGGCVAPTALRVDYSRSRLGDCCSFGNGVGLIARDRRLSTTSTTMPSRPKATWERPTWDGLRRKSTEAGSRSIQQIADPSDDLTRAFVRLSNLPTYPLDRLSR